MFGPVTTFRICYLRSPQGQTLSCGPARNQLTKAGTIIACKDLFYTHPVRRGVIRRNIAKQLEDTRVRLYRLALIYHPEVGFLLKDGELDTMCSALCRVGLYSPYYQMLLESLSHPS